MNNHKVSRILKPGSQLYLAVMAVLAVVTFFLGNQTLGMCEAAIVVLLMVYAVIRNRKHQKEMERLIEAVTYDTESATNNTLIHFPLPMAVYRISDNSIVWANQPFWTMCGKDNPSFEVRMDSLIPEFNARWLVDGKTRYAGLVEVQGKKYEVNGNVVQSGPKEENRDFMGITYWVDVTEYDSIRQEYYASRPVVMIITIDNYEELMKPLSDRQRIELRGALDEAVEKWCEGNGGLMRRYDRDRYFFIFERRHLDKFTAERFSLVESIRSIVNLNGVHATVSIGVGTDGNGYEEDFSFANLAMDMALSRGGDQAVTKNKFNFEFYGGRGVEVETRTKVKSRVMAASLAHLVQDASQMLIMGHRYADIDVVGSAAGICAIARKYGCQVHVVLDPEHHAAEALVNMLKQNETYAKTFITPEDAMVMADNKTLLVVVDTNRPEQVESEDLLIACSAKLAVIDHHRRAASYIKNATLTLCEPSASSVGELVTEMMEELLDAEDILPAEADAVLAGIVLDTKHFTIRTGERTFDAAAYLRRVGADTTRVKLLFQNGLEETVERYDVMKQARLYKGVAIAASGETKNRVVAAQAADELLNVSGVSASAVLYPTGDNGVAVSARSIGDINVQVLLEKLGGGGNRSAAGAQMKDTTMEEALRKLSEAIDEYRDTE